MPTEKMPKHCRKAMSRLYVRKGTEKRSWIGVGYICNLCSTMLTNKEAMHKSKLTYLLAETIPKMKDKVEEFQSLIIEVGSCNTRVGYAGETTPRWVFESTVNFDENEKVFIRETGQKIIKPSKKAVEVITFDDAGNKKVNWSNFELFVDEIYRKTNLDPTKTPVLFLENIKDEPHVDSMKGKKTIIEGSSLPEVSKEWLMKEPKKEKDDTFKEMGINRRKVAEILFGKMKVPALYFSMSELLDLYSTQRETGVVVMVGHSNTRIVPIYAGYVIIHAISVRKVGCKDVIEALNNDITASGLIMDESQKDIIKNNTQIASEELLFVRSGQSENEEIDHRKLERVFKLHDEQYYTLREIRYNAPERIMRLEPLTTRDEEGTLADAIIESIQKADLDLAKEFYENIILTGGGSMYEGFVEKIKRELKEKAPEGTEIGVIVKPRRLHSSWLGGSILGLSEILSNNNLWVRIEEYDESGPSVVDRCI